ncbi:2-amino-4-hydroxy-6-hydroxymethyldihydropteridine diphosphokinase [Deinococcus navajonensis]|uniref:2-amino-4-hydroxy-6-hydroxymethyldihydropteridine diphosphokinase n=1 Tax=Deinococcus navajonensis TaxID=309884 RepID=A0ABV8XQA7_9DEIO
MSPGDDPEVYVALGANLGDAVGTLRWAVREIARLGKVQAISGLYRTAPVGGPPGQPDYLNAALCLHTPHDAPTVLRALHAIEAQAGRERHERWEARVLDLDLLLYGTQVWSEPELSVPHSRAWDRAFVLRPLADLAPALRHPVTGESVGEALVRVGLNGVQLVAGLDWPGSPDTGGDAGRYAGP